jgi:uncharacterized protein YggE
MGVGFYASGAAAAPAPSPTPTAPRSTTTQATILSLNVTGQATHAPDAMSASLLLQTHGPDSRTAQINLNQQMATVLQQLAQIAKLTVTTGGYSVTSSQHGAVWDATQSVSLGFPAAPNSIAAKPVLSLIGQLQANGVQLQSLTGTLQPATAASMRDAAIRSAVKALHNRETALAAALGMQVGQIQSINMGTGGTVIPLMRAMIYSARAGAPPMVQPGNVTERVNLSATVALHPTP